MCPQSFRIRQSLDDRCDVSQTWPRKPLNTNQLYEIQNAEPAAETGSTTRGQNMIRTRSIISGGLW